MCHIPPGEGQDGGSVSVEGTGQTKVEKHKQTYIKVIEQGKLKESEGKLLRNNLGGGKGRVIPLS